MYVGAICVTSSCSNGGCWVVLVIFPVNLFFVLKKIFPCVTYTPPPKKSARDLRLKENFLLEK